MMRIDFIFAKGRIAYFEFQNISEEKGLIYGKGKQFYKVTVYIQGKQKFWFELEHKFEDLMFKLVEKALKTFNKNEKSWVRDEGGDNSEIVERLLNN